MQRICYFMTITNYRSFTKFYRILEVLFGRTCKIDPSYYKDENTNVIIVTFDIDIPNEFVDPEQIKDIWTTSHSFGVNLLTAVML